MDACWAVRSWGSNGCSNPLEVIAERESIYRLLNQTTPENLSRDIANYTLDPHTRYANLNLKAVLPVQVRNLYSSDDSAAVEQCLKSPSSTICDHLKKRRRKGAERKNNHEKILKTRNTEYYSFFDRYTNSSRRFAVVVEAASCVA